jgi:hypothetical protein
VAGRTRSPVLRHFDFGRLRNSARKNHVMVFQFAAAALLATAATSSSGDVTTTCYRRMDIRLANCVGSVGQFNMHVYDRNAKTWVRFLYLSAPRHSGFNGV